MREGFLTLHQAAALAGVGRNVAYARVLDGRWPSARGPRRVYWIPEAELLEAIQRERDEAARQALIVPPTAERILRELSDVIWVIEQTMRMEGASWMEAQERLRILRASAVHLAEHAQRAAIRRAMKGQGHEADPPADRAA
ncbi:MAG TPA: hypothetical protein VHP62_01780 [Usitatibacter sp.]|nr:hypothetical protein [Usitatibacter sp.]